MKKTLLIATAAGLALSSGVEETQDNELFMNSIKNGYYTVSNAILSRPAMIAGGMQMIQNGMARPTFLNHFDEAADDEFMAKGHGGQGHAHEKQKGKKNKDGKKPRPQPVQEAQPIEQVQDNNLALEDDEFGALNVGVNGGNNGFGANAGYQGNIGRNGNWNVGGQIQTQPGGRPNWGVNAGVTIKFDETADDEFMAKHGGHGGQGHHEKQNGKKNRDGKKPRPQPQPVQEPEQVQDNNLAFEEDDEFGALNVGVNGGRNGFGANAGYQGNVGRNGNWNVGGQIQTQPGGRPNWGVNAGVTFKFDDEDNELFVEDQDDELFMQSIKNGYYTVSNAILSRPAMIAGGMQMIQNGMARPTFLNHFDETADDEFMAKGHGGQGHAHEKQKGKKNKDGKKPRPQPVQEAQPIEQVQDNNLAFEEDDEFGALNVGVNGGRNGFGANAGYQGNVGRNGNWNVGGQIQTQPGGRPNWGVNAGVTIKFDEEDNELFVEDFQDDELGALNVGVNGGRNGFGANAGYQGNVGRNGNWNVGGQIQTQPGGRPNWGVNAGVTIKFDETADDEFAATEKTQKTEKPRRHRQPLERPEGTIKRNTKLRVPKEVAADNTLFDLAELLEDN